MKEFKGQLKGFPVEVVDKMLNYQEEQGNKRDVSVFEWSRRSNKSGDGFDWDETKEGWDFWNDVISNKNFDLFFEKYPEKQTICRTEREKLIVQIACIVIAVVLMVAVDHIVSGSRYVFEFIDIPKTLLFVAIMSVPSFIYYKIR